MPSEETNPFASPSPDSGEVRGTFPSASVKKAEAIIKDAGQFWLAIAMCILCSGVGVIIIGPWYFVRLIQWKSLAERQPMLLDRDAPRGSLARRFQSAKVKLILGMSFGALILVVAILLLLPAVTTVRRAGG